MGTEQIILLRVVHTEQIISWSNTDTHQQTLQRNTKMNKDNYYEVRMTLTSIYTMKMMTSLKTKIPVKTATKNSRE